MHDLWTVWGNRVGLAEQGRAARKVTPVIQALSAVDASAVVFELYRRFYRPMTSTERVQLWRSRQRNANVSERNASVPESETLDVPQNETPRVTPPETPRVSTSSSSSFLSFYSEQFEKAFNEKPNVNYAKDGAISKRLLRQYGEDKLRGLLLEFFASQDDFILQTGYTIGVFSSVLNKLLTAKTNKKRTLSAREIWNQAQQEKGAGR